MIRKRLNYLNLELHRRALAEHAFLLRCEGLKFSEINARCGVTNSNELVHGSLYGFHKRLAKALTRTRFYLLDAQASFSTKADELACEAWNQGLDGKVTVARALNAGYRYLVITNYDTNKMITIPLGKLPLLDPIEKLKVLARHNKLFNRSYLLKHKPTSKRPKNSWNYDYLLRADKKLCG